MVCKTSGYYKNVYLKDEDYLSENELRRINRQRWIWRSLLLIPVFFVCVLTAIYLLSAVKGT